MPESAKYSAESLSNALRGFEARYGITTAEFMATYAVIDPVEGIDPFTCHV